MNPLARAAAVLETRLRLLEQRLGDGDETALQDFCLVAQTLVALSTHATPTELLTTKQMAEAMQITPRALLRGAKRGKVAGLVRLGQRGRGAVRWETGR